MSKLHRVVPYVLATAATLLPMLPAAARSAQVPLLPAAAIAARKLDVTVGASEALHVESTGSGDPVVIVPGLFGSAFGFRKIVGPIAAQGHRVVVVEPLGIGTSSRPKSADYSLEAQARRVGAVLDSLHIASATFVAHSVGASVVLRLALDRPGLVREVISLEGGVAESAGTPGLRRALSLAGLLGHFGLQSVARGKMRGRFRDSSGDPSWITDPVMAGYMAPLKDDYQDAIAAYKAMASAPREQALAPRLARLRCPVELLLGTAEHDGGIGAEELALMRARIPQLAIVPVPGAGHWIQEERPQAVIDALRKLAP